MIFNSPEPRHVKKKVNLATQEAPAFHLFFLLDFMLKLNL